MFSKRTSLALAAAGLTVSAAIAAVAMAPVRITGFGPPVSNDRSLNANLGVLSQIVAWQNSPDADAYQLAEKLPDRGATFTRVARASIP